MLIATDGACKRNGDPTCSSIGVAWIVNEEGHSDSMLFKARFERGSTSQRGEINGLLEALEYAKDNLLPDETLTIVTDSEYLYNTIEKDWIRRWVLQNWIGASGPVKNPDMWKQIAELLDSPQLDGNVFMQWTKGHLISFTKSATNSAMRADVSGVELYDRITSVATRPADIERIVRDFNINRRDHGYIQVPKEAAIEWAVCNTVADTLASYLINTFDDLLV